MERGGDAGRDAALNPALLEEEEGASERITLLQEGGNEEAEEADTAVAADGPLAAPPPADVDVARRVVTRWRAFVVERKGVLLIRLLQELPDLFVMELLTRLDNVDRTMLAQVGRPWLAAVLASGLPRVPTGVIVCLRLPEFCTSVERLAWARANGFRWGVSKWDGSDDACALAADGGHLEALQWARQHDCPWDVVRHGPLGRAP